MRFTKIHIDGYGRFNDVEIELTPGLQIIAGPNEHGKSTIRHFIGDMLYGQKRNATKRIYEDSNELRAPWTGAETYGGRLCYVLDDGDEIEVHRVFDKNNEKLTVFNRTAAQDITGDFPILKNRESTFAEHHLNMTKSVFLGMATISHLSLTELGDKDALIRIRECLLSLTDSGNESGSAEKATDWLNARIASIGQRTSRTKPLPMTRNRLAELQQEYQKVFDAYQEIKVIDKQNLTVMEEIGRLSNQKGELENALQQSRAQECMNLLEKANVLTEEIDLCARESMLLAPNRDFPLEDNEQVAQLHTQYESSVVQVERTESSIQDLQGQIDETLDRLSNEGVLVMKEADPEFETQLADLEAEIQGLNYRIEETKGLNARCQKGYMDAQSELAALPDFSQFAAEPIERITKLTAASDAAGRMRDEESTQKRHISELLEQKQEQIELPKELFAEYSDFVAVLRSHESMTTENEDKLADLYGELEELKHDIDDRETRMPGLFLSTFFWLIVVIVVLVVERLTGNAILFLIAGLVAAIFSLSGLMAFFSRRRIDREIYRLTSIESDIERYELTLKKDTEQFDTIREATHCESLREIEAVYEQYVGNRAERDRIQDHLELQTEREADAVAHATELFVELQSMFEEIGGHLESEEDVNSEAMQAIGRYQEYRDTKRRGNENRDALNRYIEELEDLEIKLNRVKAVERELSLEVRQFLRDNHYDEESQHESALKALRAYRIRSAQVRHRQGDVEVIQGQIKVLRQSLEREQEHGNEFRTELEKHLVEAGADSIEEYLEKFSNAQRHQDLRLRRFQLEEQLSALLGDETINSLNERVTDYYDPNSPESRTPDFIRKELSGNQELLEAKRKREQSLQILMAERGAGLRSLNEVDEERDATMKRLSQLELELQAASYAATVMEDVTQKRHSKIAPQLAELASLYLSTITDDAYNELLINRDMQVSIRIPQTQALNQDPGRLLSKGTVDQIYLSLRLAMVKTMSEDAEQIPMVLDDPFAHYDDSRVQSAMRLMAEVGETSQVLLFTCRDDVVRAAESVGARIFHI
ncbi:MAG: AAA family ATPase [Candidatus Hydrogenedentota bacterium]